MGGGQCHLERVASQQHHRLQITAGGRQILGVAAEGDARLVDDALLQRSGDHPGKLAAATALQRPVQKGQHGAGVAYIQLPGNDRRCHGQMLYAEAFTGDEGST